MNKSKAPALAKGLDIIDLIRKNGSLSFIDLQELTSDNPASLSRYLHTLIEKNYIIKNNSGRYELGLKLIDLKDNKGLWPRLIKHSRPVLTKLNQNYGVTVLLLAYSADTYVAIDKVIALDNLGMMEKHSICPNDYTSIWSNLYYQSSPNMSPSDLVSKHALGNEDDVNIQRSIKLTDLANTKGYITHSSKKHEIYRIGIPIYYQNQVIASLGIGTFINILSKEKTNDLITESLVLSKELSKLL